MSIRLNLVGIGQEFWRFVERDEPPPLTNLEDAQRAYPQHRPERIQGDAETLAAVAEIKALDVEIKNLATTRDRLKLEVHEFMGEHEVLLAGDRPAATWRTPKSTFRTNWQAAAELLADSNDELAVAAWLSSQSKPNSRRFLTK